MEEQDIQLTRNWKQVCEITTALARAYKSRQLYAANNPVRHTSLDSVFLALTDFLQQNEMLTFSVTESQFIYYGKAVYSNPDRRESPVFRLYRDGIRFLSFHEGITREELGELLDALSEVSPEGGEGDMDVVTQIWERDLAHITYIAVDDCLDFDDSELAASPEPQSSQAGQPSQGVESLDVAESPESFEPSRPAYLPPEMKQPTLGVATIVDSPFTEEERKSIANVFLSEEDLDEIGQQVLTEDRQSPREKVSEIFLEILDGSWGSEVKTDVTRGLGVLCGDLLEDGNPTQATKILREMKEFASQEASLPKDFVKMAKNFVQARGREGELVRLEPRLEEANLHELENYECYLCELPTSAIPQVYGILARARGRKVREMLCRVLSKMAKGNLDALADMITDPRWYLVRNLVTIFRLMKDRRALVYLEGLLYHEETRVRAEVVHCLSEIGGQEANILLCRCLQDSEKSIRMLAVRKLSREREELGASAIADSIKEKSFRKRSTDEKREFFDALGRSASDDLIPSLEEFITKRSLFHGPEADEMRRFAAMALARIGTEKAIGLLEKTAQSGNSKARKYCTEALKLYKLRSSVQEEKSQEHIVGANQRSDVARER
ncbi:MAG: hypothetical protein AMJ46_11610 [Latescibacteria bacterium DG_63]|nr:MAG: hypothetical protein AMJ46_11610 [Latescibacteria bacterium DG_63]